MTRTIVFGLVIWACMDSPLADADSPAKWFPPSTIAYAELSDPAQLVSTVFDHPLRAKIESLEPYKMAVKTPEYRRFQMGRAFIESHFDMPWREAVSTYTQHGVAIGFDAESQGVAVIIHGKDESSMKDFRDKLIELAQFRPEGDEIESVKYRGVTAYKIDEARFAIHGDRLLLTNNAELGKAILDRLIDRQGDSLADNQRFQDAGEKRDKDLTAWAFFDIEVIRGSGVADNVYRDRIDNPVLEALLGGIQSSLGQTPYVAAGLSAKTEGMGVQVSMPHEADWVPEEREYFFGPDGAGRGPALPETNETLLTLSTYRDFSQLWLRSGDLFGAQINDGFAQADATLTTLFAGRDFGEDILGAMEPEVGLVATRQDFSGKLPSPTIKIPAFALVLELREPETMTRELRRIFQSLIGFLNVVGAMNGQNQLELDMEKLKGGAELISSTFVPEEDDRESTQAGIIFNFTPTVGFAGRRFVVSSTKSLAEQLVTASPADPQLIVENTRAQLNADTLRKVLDDNRGQLIAQNMLEEGNSREEAEAAIDLLLQVVGYMDDASLKLSTDDQQMSVEFEVGLKP